MDERSKTVVLHPLVGKTLKQYRLDGVLGQGGMGVVYRAQDTKLQRQVAVKLLPTELSSDAPRRKRFLQEARTAARVTHPAIAQIYDVDEQDGAIFIAMELVEGKTIHNLIQNGEIDLRGAVDIALQIAGGLAKAHESGIVHRDVKPGNVIQTPDGHVKILDFGLAKLSDPDSTSGEGLDGVSTLTRTQVGVVKGTPAYMSPEQVKAQTVDARSDIFSLGVMLYEMSTGEAPFLRANVTETMHAIAFDEAPPMRTFRPNLPGELQHIVSRCMEKSPADRYPDTRALMAELLALRRSLDSGTARPLSWKDRIADNVRQLRHLKPPQYGWLLGGVVVAGIIVYLLVAKEGIGTILAFAFCGLFVYRRMRDQPRRMLQAFVREISAITEVRFISFQDNRITVGVDRTLSQLYTRINDRLHQCNRKLFFGQPFSVVIRPDLTPEETRQLLSSQGVQYVRDNALQVDNPSQPRLPPPLIPPARV